MIHMQLVFGRLCKTSCSRHLVACDNYIYDNVYIVSRTITHIHILTIQVAYATTCTTK